MQRTRSLEATPGRSLVVIFLLSALSVQAETHSFYGRVVSVSDGDTVTVLDRQYQEHKIRLNGIDAPEAGQDFGQVSRMNLAKLVFGKEVLIIRMDTDKYERDLARIVFDRTDANLEQVRAGMAWFYRAYERDIPGWYREALDEAERDARTARRGLWQHRNPVPPWEFRAKKREQNGPGSTPARESGKTVTRISGNRNSGIYHRSDCPDFDRVSEKNRIYFKTEEEAKKAGYRKARNCQ
ncbi:MAG: thermonuclease family protein [Acidobacteria bacterium]|nr:thermonuclease family protein [Acidobacteriota bacterium]